MKPTTNTLTEEMRSTIDKAIILIEPYNKEVVCYRGYYFEKQGKDELDDTEICDNQSCYGAMLSQLRKNYPHSKITGVIYDHQNNECFKSCAICGIKLSDGLNGMEQEFEHHEQHSITKEDITNSDNAFCIENMLRAFPTYEYMPSTYALHQYSLGNSEHYNQSVALQKEFYERVVKYALLIIQLLTA